MSLAEVSGSSLAGAGSTWTTLTRPGQCALPCVGRHVETGQGGRPFGVVFQGAGAIAGLEGGPFLLSAHPEGLAAKAKVL